MDISNLIRRDEKGATLAPLIASLRESALESNAMQAKFYYLQKQALQMLTLAIYHGDLTPSNHCQKCGNISDHQLDGHHENYSKPLEVIWLCRDCHIREHRRDGHIHSRLKKTSPRLDRALQYFREHPEYLYAPSREFENQLSISYGTIHKAQQIVRNELAASQQSGGGESEAG